MAMARCTSSLGAGTSGRMQLGACIPPPLATVGQAHPVASVRRLAAGSQLRHSYLQKRLYRGCIRPPALQRLRAQPDDAAPEPSEPAELSSQDAQAAAGGMQAESTAYAVGAVSTPSSSEAEVATSSSSSSSSEQDPFLSSSAASVGFAALAAVHAALAAALALAAPTVAASALNLGWPGGQQLAYVLIGCCAASLVRSASLCWFLKEGASHRELNTWRYQRANIALLLAALSAAATQLLGWNVANPALLAVLTAVAAATAWLSGCTALAAARHGIVFATGLDCIADPLERLQAFGVYLLRDIGTVAGVLLAVITCMSAWGAGQLLLRPPVVGSEVALAALLSGAAVPPPALTYLQRLLGAGLVVAAAQSMLLLEHAHYVQRVSLDVATKLAILRGLEEGRDEQQGQQVPAPNAPLPRFRVLHAGMFAALALQALFLAQAPALGVDVNSSAALWGVQYWTLLAGGAYAFTLAATFDWVALADAVIELFSKISGGIGLVVRTVYYDWAWSEARRR